MQTIQRTMIIIGVFGVLVTACWATENTAASSYRPKPDFATMKQEMIKRLSTELTCVQAAKDETALRSCRPRPPQGGPQGGPPPSGQTGDIPFLEINLIPS